MQDTAQKEKIGDIIEILRTCYLYSQDEKYDEIAEDLNISKATVARRLAVGRKLNLLKTKTTIELPPEIRDNPGLKRLILINPRLERELSKRFSNVDEITIVPSGSSKEEALERVARAAAELIEGMLEDCEPGEEAVLGFNWGRIVEAVIDELTPPPIDEAIIEKSDLIITPLLGDFHLGMGAQSEEFHSYQNSRIVSAAAQKLGVPERNIVKLTFQSFIPADFDGLDFDIITRYLHRDFSFRRVFKERDGLIYRTGTILTGIGSIEKSAERWLRLINDDECIQELETLKDCGAVGDIAQHFVDINGEEPESVKRINRSVIGLRLEHFSDLVARHRANPNIGAGLVVVASGEEKYRILHALMKFGANHVIADKKLGERVLDLADSLNSD